jgi:50S ribosomal protein L16 3-hydroxylase
MRPPPETDTPMLLLGGLSPAAFMRRHWQKRPLLVRQAMPGVRAPLGRKALFALAANEAVESRLVVQNAAASIPWRLRRGPLSRRALPPVAQAGWTLLVQGLDLHVEAAHALLARFRFIPQARLDDLMLSWASDGGGVGPHVDSYDVFLLQVEGRRRWRAGPLRDATLRPDVPLKILANFEPTDEWLLEPGDMLYLPPGWAHDGVAVGECMTASVGFRAPDRAALAGELLARLADRDAEDGAVILYRDPAQPATGQPGRVPKALGRFAADALARAVREPRAVDRALGESLSEPKPQVWFAGHEGFALEAGVQLHPASRMLYDDAHVFLNGESWRAAGRDATLLRRLADRGALTPRELARASADARTLLADWARSGWLRPLSDEPHDTEVDAHG